MEAVILPKLNERDVAEIPRALRKGMDFHFVENMTNLLELALVPAREADARAN